MSIKKQYLFSYGSLQNEKVQVALYNRTLIGTNDRLLGYKVSEQKIESLYPIIFKTNNSNDIVEGIVFEVFDKELIETDSYEGNLYQRVNVLLESGQTAWCYVMHI